MTDEESGLPAGPPRPEGAVELDAKRLRALAHPVRVQLVGLLRTHGPSTATRLAERMGLTSGATSYHLRQLAAAGFVAEDTGRGNARERWWHAVHRSTWFTDMGLADREPEAALGYLQSIVTAHTRTAQRALGALPTMPRPWRDVFDLNDWALRLTPEEATRLGAELVELVGRYRQAGPQDTTAEPDGTARVAVVVQLLPQPTEGPEPGAATMTPDTTADPAADPGTPAADPLEHR
ncbi:helix-turn-helix domain-containing protein [Kitasatospora herbaricolor]|uniref:Helix-turn-helix domain-containing protein n=1 Tax=Kitasatospora herbaricolor TaxID=68217 RepID=A0ABZ1WGL2_9ACTN|nr:helix-turn-helix domain-containing protein [Kitasatospora herbaricolor]